MITSEGFGLIAELIAAAMLIATLTGFAITRSQPWLISVVITFMILIVAVTIVIELVDLKCFCLFTRADKEVLTGYFAAILCSTGSQVSCSFLTNVMTSSGVMARE